MEKTLEQLTEHIKEGNDNNQLLLIENFVMLNEINSVLESIESKLTAFFKEYQEQILAQQEAAAEAGRQLPSPPADSDGVGSGTSAGDSKGGFLGIAALLTVAKMFDVDEVIRLPATLTVMFKKVALFGKQISTLSDIFMAGVRGVTAVTRAANGTFQRLTQFQRYINDVGKVVGAFIKPLQGAIQFLKPIGTFLKPLGAFLKPLGALFSKIALPITVIFGVLDAIEGFTKTFADTKSVLRSIRGAIVAVLDGLVGTLVRFAGDIVAFIPDIIGLDAVAETIKNLFGNITDGILKSFGGIVDIILGIFAPGSGQFTEGLKSLFGGMWDALTEILLFPINSVINFVRDIFGFSKEDAPPFRMQDLIGEAVDSIKQWFADLFDFEFPSFDFDMNSVLRGLLPAPDSFFAKFIPDSVYKSVGLNPQTGEALETPEPSSDEPLKTRVMTNEGFKELTKEEIVQGRKEGTIKRSVATDAIRELGMEEKRRGAEIPSQAGEQVQTPRGTGEVTARGAMAIPGPSQETQATSETTKVIGRTSNNPGVVVERNGKPVALSEEDRAYVESINAVRTAMGGEAYDLSQNEVKEQRRGAEVPSQAGQQVQAPEGTGEVTARGAMAIPGVGTGTQQSGGGFLESITQTASNASQTVSDLVNSTVLSLSDFASTASDTVSQNVSEAVDYVSDISANIGDTVSQNVVDPVISFFSDIGDQIAGVLDISGMIGRIKKYMINMFAEVGIPRVEMDVPIIGKVGFGPFYPFRPDEGITSVDAGSDIVVDNRVDEETRNKIYDKTQTSRTTSIDDSNIMGLGQSSNNVSTVNELGERVRTTTSSRVLSSFNDQTGKAAVSIKTNKMLDNYTTGEYKELENVVNRYEVGPIVAGKVRRMIDAGATPQQVEEYIKETQKSVGDKIKSFLAPAADAVSNVTESVSNLFGGDTNTVAGADQQQSGGGFLESITQTMSNASQTVSDVVNSTVTLFSEFASTTSDTVSQNVSQAVDYVSDISANIGDMVSENVVDPVISFFSDMGSKISSLLDFSGMIGKIKDYMMNMFAEVGIPRVEMDVPIIGKVGFGPFYPFAPSNETSGGRKTTMNAISAGQKISSSSKELYDEETGDVVDQYSDQRDFRVTDIEGVQNYDVQYANASESQKAIMDANREEYGEQGSGISLMLNSSLEQSQATQDYSTGRLRSKDEKETNQYTNIFGRQDYNTGERFIEVEKTLQKYEGDSAVDLQHTVERYDIGPLQFGKVRRMINEGATAEQVEQYLKETQKSTTEKLKSFLAPAADAMSNVTESVSNLFGGDTSESNIAGGLSSMVSNLFGGEQNILSTAGDYINNAASAIQSNASNLAQSISPVANKALTAPVGESSEKVKAAGAATNILAPTTNNISPVNNNTSVTNVNRTTVASASPRSNDPSFMRLQTAIA